MSFLKQYWQYSLIGAGVVLLLILGIILLFRGCDKTNTYTINFDANGGGLVQSITYDEKETFTLPDEPDKEGHTFVGWYFENTDNSEMFLIDLLSGYAEDNEITLYAIWSINTHRVTFVTDGGLVISPRSVEYGHLIIVPEDSQKDGFDFTGWYEDAEATVPFDFTSTTMPDHDVTIYAGWALLTYDVFYETNGGVAMDSTKVVQGATVTPEDPTKLGHRFVKWFYDAALTEAFDPDRITTRDITLYAGWATNQYTITFDSNGGSMVGNLSRYFGTEIAEPEEPSKPGHTFEGWFTDALLTNEFVFSTMPAESPTLYAKWDVNTYTITFDTQGGDAIGPMDLAYGTALDQYVLTKDDYSFKGWVYDDGVTLATHVREFNETVYAQWIPDIEMVEFGSLNTFFFPAGPDDISVALDKGFWIATTETTYEVWYDVLAWANNNGYNIINAGQQGSTGGIGSDPDPTLASEPVTYVSWHDVIVWTNAYSEMSGLEPVYRNPMNGEIYRDSNGMVGPDLDNAAQTDNNGYRLPTSDEWEMAARWRNSSGDGAILVGERYWTPGDYASGATGDYTNDSATQMVAWYADNASLRTHPVKTKAANGAGLYDMSGNVAEWVYDWNFEAMPEKQIRGGYFMTNSIQLTLSTIESEMTNHVSAGIGFRLVRNL